MRPSLIPGLVTSAQKNADRGFPRRGAVRGRAGVQRRQARGPAHRCVRACGARSRKPSGAGRHWSGNGEADVFDVKADALAVLVAAGAPSAGAAGRARRAELAASGALRHDPDRPAECARLFRRAASARARGARCRGPADGVRGHSRAHPRAEGEADARQAGARPLRRSSR